MRRRTEETMRRDKERDERGYKGVKGRREKGREQKGREVERRRQGKVRKEEEA